LIIRDSPVMTLNKKSLYMIMNAHLPG
jgi:hypothetical protein